jgi:hypothetical protein
LLQLMVEPVPEHICDRLPVDSLICQDMSLLSFGYVSVYGAGEARWKKRGLRYFLFGN